MKKINSSLFLIKQCYVFIKKIITFLENTPITFSLWLTTFTAIIVIRIFIENWINNFSHRDLQFLFNEFTHTFLFFLFSYILFLILLRFFAKTSLRVTSNILLWGFLIILTPPLIDNIISEGSGFWSFYIFDSLSGLLLRFFTFFGDNPTIGITYGVRIEVAISLFLFFSYILFKTQNFLRALAGAFIGYVAFFILGTFPSWITFFIVGWTKGFFEIHSTEIASIFLSPEAILSSPPGSLLNALNIKMSLIYAFILSTLVPILSLIFFKKIALSLFANVRIPQLLYHGNLVWLGGGLALIFSPQTLTHFTFFNTLSFLLLVIASYYAWLATIIPNDIFDLPIDAISNSKRPLVKKTISHQSYKTLGWNLFGTSLLLVTLSYPYLLFLFVIYHSLAWIYNSPPFRIKRFPFIATFVSALASILMLFAGYIAIDSSRTLEYLPLEIIFFLLFVYTISLPIKDFKDRISDKKAHIWTIPVLLGEKKSRFFIGIGIFFSFISSVIVFNMYSLAPWALLFGSLSFWVVTFPHISFLGKKLYPRYLPHSIFLLTLLYGLLLVWEISKVF
jgi:4-hydroxybenzoate polyprenyltransferase